MNRAQIMKRRKQMQRRRRFFSLVFLVLAIIIIVKIDLPSKFQRNEVEASSLLNSVELMSRTSPINTMYTKKQNEILKSNIEKEIQIREERAKIEADQNRKIAYLTFDDGPSPNVTPQILETLNKYDVKATFFVIGKNVDAYPNILKRTYDEGHALAYHSYTHDYGLVYASTDSFLDEMKRTEIAIQNVVGEDFSTKVIRFPGGSHGDKKNPFKDAATQFGYKYYDWNALNGDAEGPSFSKDWLVNRLKETTLGQKELVVLMHDMGGKQTTADALPEIIEFLKSEGYEFGVLN